MVLNLSASENTRKLFAQTLNENTYYQAMKARNTFCNF